MPEQPLISIPKPCHEDWNKMTPNDQGAFCKSCCKTVIDFTQKTTTEIKDFFSSLGKEKVCGRFRSGQVMSQTVPVPQQRFRFQRFMAALYLVFGAFLFSSCGSNGDVVGKLAVNQDTATQQLPPVDTNKILMGDSIAPEPMRVGEVAYPQDTSSLRKNKPVCKPLKQDKETVHDTTAIQTPVPTDPPIMGGAIYVPPTPK